MSENILGIDIRDYAVKIIEVELSKEKIKPLRYSIDYFTQGKESPVQIIEQALKSNNFVSRNARVSILGQEVCKVVQIPVMPDKEVSSAIKFKVASDLPFPIDDAQISFYRLNSAAASMWTYFVCAVSKSYVSGLYNSLRRIGLNVIDIIPGCLSLKNVSLVPGEEEYAVANIGKNSTLIVFIRNNQVVFAREFKVGGSTLTQSMVGIVYSGDTMFELDYAKAEELKKKYGIPSDFEQYTEETGIPASEIMSLMRPVLEKMGAEIVRTFEYYKNDTEDGYEFKKIYFTGSGANTKNSLRRRQRDDKEIFKA